MNVEHFNQACDVINKAFETPLGRAMFKDDQLTNIINRIGKNLGYEQLSVDDGELYQNISTYIQSKKTPMTESKKLNEASFELPTPKNILRYDDDIVVKSIQDIIKKDFDNITVEHIKGDEGGAFYTMTVSLSLAENIHDDLERKRFHIMQTMATFKAQFFGAISGVLPVINMNTGSYEFTKNSTKLRFAATLCLSHTNDRDWVSGVYKGPEQKKRENIKESSASHKHALKSMSLNSAIQSFKNQRMDRKMLETAIKACGRNELEFYVLRAIGLGVEVDLSDIEPDSEAEAAAPKPKVGGSEKPYNPNDKIA